MAALKLWMLTVYRSSNWPGPESMLFGIFSTRAKAHDYAKKLQAESPKGTPGGVESWRVEGMTVDDP